MREKTAEEYLAAVKSVLDSVKTTISEIADEVGVHSEKERQALMHGVTIGANAARPDLTRSVALKNGWGDFDWKEVKKTYLAGPEPSREEKEAALKLLKTAPHLIRRALRSLR